METPGRAFGHVDFPLGCCSGTPRRSRSICLFLFPWDSDWKVSNETQLGDQTLPWEHPMANIATEQVKTQRKSIVVDRLAIFRQP